MGQTDIVEASWHCRGKHTKKHWKQMVKSRNSVSGAGPLKSTSNTYVHSKLFLREGCPPGPPPGRKNVVYRSGSGRFEGPSSWHRISGLTISSRAASLVDYKAVRRRFWDQLGPTKAPLKVFFKAGQKGSQTDPQTNKQRHQSQRRV